MLHLDPWLARSVYLISQKNQETVTRMNSNALGRESSSDGIVSNIGKNLKFGVSLGKVLWK